MLIIPFFGGVSIRAWMCMVTTSPGSVGFIDIIDVIAEGMNSAQ